MAAERAVFFVDGSNWYHSLIEAGLTAVGRLRYPAICDKLAGPGRQWTGMRYYIPDVGIIGNPSLLREQREFLRNLAAQDPRITIHLGRLEPRKSESAAAQALLHYLANLRTRIDIKVYKDLVGIGRTHKDVRVFVEKALDVQIAVDMLELCANDAYDVAYLLSADGDYTPAVRAVAGHGKRVFSATPAPCAQLAAAVHRHIPLNRSWFADCYIGPAPSARTGPSTGA